ncbi:cytidyltransferase like protein [Nitzschia inconspicua]|uniref:Cytidyltransferase like protein n=1 Tax=Nitzschia inconspicua TaxID=303405 RepID=A0A9K3M5P2_9STRA|nr:cytidyltransferase like protein [Nitzschia inconspicua]
MNGHHGNSNSNGFASHGKSPSSYSDLASANNLVVKTTENWLELFLTTPEKFKFGQWKEEIRDKSVSGYLTKPLWNYLAQQIPPTIAPNVLALFGLGLLIQAWYITYGYHQDYPVACSWLAVFGILSFFVLNSVVNVHADRIRQRTPLGDFFKYATDSAATVFLSILTTYCLGGSQDESMEAQWYAVQIAQLVLYVKHLSAFHRQAGLRFSLFSGPGEVIGTAVTLLAIRATLGLEWMVTVYETLLQYISQTTGNVKVTETPGNQLLKIGYYSMYLLAVTKTMLLREPHGWSRFGLSASLLMRLIPAFLYFQLGSDRGCGMSDVICDGLFMAVLTSDITLAKMAGREVHPWVVLMSLSATFSHSVILALCITYYIAVFADLCAYLNMPLLTTCRNVYCDGIYDLCHIGHKLLFQNALQYGNRLFVGVVGDKDAQNYKRPPIMTSKERCAEVEACKAVTKVIPDAPCFGLTREFLDEHQIHVVAYGEEYLERYPDPKDDPYYRVPREMGIARPLPRTKGLSTSDLIRRIQQAQPADEKVSPT